MGGRLYDGTTRLIHRKECIAEASAVDCAIHQTWFLRYVATPISSLDCLVRLLAFHILPPVHTAVGIAVTILTIPRINVVVAQPADWFT